MTWGEQLLGFDCYEHGLINYRHQSKMSSSKKFDLYRDFAAEFLWFYGKIRDTDYILKPVFGCFDLLVKKSELGHGELCVQNNLHSFYAKKV